MSEVCELRLSVKVARWLRCLLYGLALVRWHPRWLDAAIAKGVKVSCE